MRIGYYIRNYVVKDSFGRPAISGGVKIISLHVKLLNEIGYETFLFTRNLQVDNLKELNLFENPIIVKGDTDFSHCDIIIASRYSDVKELHEKKIRKIAHLCQGYEPIEYESRIKGEAEIERYERKGFLRFLSYFYKRKFKRKIKYIELIYSLPTIKLAVSPHLSKLIENKYKQKCYLIRNGIDPNIFYPNQNRKWAEGSKIKILSVGSSQIGFKGISDTLSAIRILKEKGFPIEFIRVSPHPPSKREMGQGLVDQYFVNLKEKEISELFRNVDIFISSSLEGEGFGLPAMEALASGVPSILTEISSYLSFDEKKDFAYFVPTNRPDMIAGGILKLIKDEKLRGKYQQRGLGVAKMFTVEKMKEDLSKFIKSIKND